MFLQNEKNGKIQLMDQNEILALKTDLKNISNVPSISEAQLNQELADYYNMAHSIEMKSMGLESAELFGINIPDILKKIKKFICSILKPGSTTDEIIDAILQALASIIPGGFLLKPLVQKLVKFVLDQGIGIFCKIA